MALPRVLTLHTDGTLGVEPVPELQRLRSAHYRWTDARLTPSASTTLPQVRGYMRYTTAKPRWAAPILRRSMRIRPGFGRDRLATIAERRSWINVHMAAFDVLPYIFTDVRLPLAVQFAQWLQASPRFRAFAETHRDKIRKKVRVVTEAEGYGDLHAELATAYSLLLERRFLVEYEKYGVGKRRGPDFSVTYKTHIRFDVEVTRLRGTHAEATTGPGKLVNTLCAKLAQLPPSMINLLVLASDDALYGEDELARGLLLLQERAKWKDDAFFMRRGFRGARDFLSHYHRLSAIRLLVPDASPILHLQVQARRPMPPDLAACLRR